MQHTYIYLLLYGISWGACGAVLVFEFVLSHFHLSLFLSRSRGQQKELYDNPTGIVSNADFRKLFGQRSLKRAEDQAG